VRAGPIPPLYSSSGYDFDVAMASAPFASTLQQCAQVASSLCSPSWLVTLEQWCRLRDVVRRQGW
jgi:hypothetical protein